MGPDRRHPVNEHVVIGPQLQLSPGDNPGSLSPGVNSTLYVTFRATDNVAVASTQATVNRAPVVLNSVAGDANRCQGGVYSGGTQEGFVAPVPTGLIVLSIRATDTSGNAYELTYRFTVAP